jgi:uncharacterized protein (TIGR00369 family)
MTIGLHARLTMPSPLDEFYGLQLIELTDSVVTAHVPVRPAILQPLGMVHGGVYPAIAEALSSLGTNKGLPEGFAALGMSNATNFLRPVSSGTIHAAASVLHRGRTTWVWDVAFTDDSDRRCAVTRMTLAVRSIGETR